MKFIKKIIKLILNKYFWYFWLVFIPLLAGWLMLTIRLQTRTDFAGRSQLNSVKRIWGDNLAQPMPSVRYKGFSSDVPTLNRGDIDGSDILIKLTVDYRKKGLVYYTGYNADFQGKYTIKNPEKEKVYLSFIFPYPLQQSEGILQDVQLRVNGKEDTENTEYQPNLALWTGMLEPEQALEMTMHYKGRGLNNFIYGFEPNRQINNFTLKIAVIGTQQVDYPVSTMTPTKTENTAEGSILTWQLDRSLTQMNIGVILPDKLNIARQIAVMAERAPVFFLMFLVSLFGILTIGGFPVHFLKIVLLSAAYFLFYPLFAYLSAYLHVILAFAISFGILGLLMWNYARLVFNGKVAIAIVTAYTFYLGITSVAALLPTYTGLILVIEGVVLLAVIMHVLSRYRDLHFGELLGWAKPDDQQTEPPQEPETEPLYAEKSDMPPEPPVLKKGDQES